MPELLLGELDSSMEHLLVALSDGGPDPSLRNRPTGHVEVSETDARHLREVLLSVRPDRVRAILAEAPDSDPRIVALSASISRVIAAPGYASMLNTGGASLTVGGVQALVDDPNTSWARDTALMLLRLYASPVMHLLESSQERKINWLKAVGYTLAVVGLAVTTAVAVVACPVTLGATCPLAAVTGGALGIAGFALLAAIDLTNSAAQGSGAAQVKEMLCGYPTNPWVECIMRLTASDTRPISSGRGYIDVAYAQRPPYSPAIARGGLYFDGNVPEPAQHVVLGDLHVYQLIGVIDDAGPFAHCSQIAVGEATVVWNNGAVATAVGQAPVFTSYQPPPPWCN